MVKIENTDPVAARNKARAFDHSGSEGEGDDEDDDTFSNAETNLNVSSARSRTLLPLTSKVYFGFCSRRSTIEVLHE